MTDPHLWAADRNRTMNRGDIEWFVAPSGELMLRDKPSWQAKRTNELARNAERDRRDWMHRQNFPVTASPNHPTAGGE